MVAPLELVNAVDVTGCHVLIIFLTIQLSCKGGVQKIVKPFFEHPHHP